MPYQRTKRRDVSRYVQAGYQQDDELFIERVPAGSSGDRLRDLNRRGYARNDDTPEPMVLERQTARGSAGRQRAQSAPKQGFFAAVAQEAQQDKSAAAVCAMLFAVILFLGFFWSGKIMTSMQNRRDIEYYNRMTLACIDENQSLAAQLDYAQSGEIIRNRAQNEYGMIRRERADTSKIYIQIPDSTEIRNDEEQEEPRFELLDVLLGTLDRLHIGI